MSEFIGENNITNEQSLLQKAVSQKEAELEKERQEAAIRAEEEKQKKEQFD